MTDTGWIGFDLDGTLAHYVGWRGIEHIGDPVPAMATIVREYLELGYDVRIFTARVSRQFEDRDQAAAHIQDWTEKHFGARLIVTCEKDFSMWLLYDDRAISVEENTGELRHFRALRRVVERGGEHMMLFNADQVCEYCGTSSPRVPVCGECEIANRLGLKIADLEEELGRCRAKLAAIEEAVFGDKPLWINSNVKKLLRALL